VFADRWGPDRDRPSARDAFGHLFGLFGPFGPFSPFRRRKAWKYLLAAAVARAALEDAAQRFGARRRGRGARRFPDFGRWRMEPALGRRDKVGKDREQYEEKEGTMPRFGRGFPGFEKPHGAPKHFDRGDVKYVLLDLLREGPRHGYDMIKELEQRSGGLYSPSPGSVYPTLQMLEDQGLVTSTTVDGKRTYRLTDAGYAFIEERKERTHDARGRSWLESEHFREELRSMGREAGELARSLRHAVRSYTPDPQQMKEIRDVIGETRKRIEAILAERRDAPRDEERDKPTVV
jgi:DNA-binding PadR family transcriptional regulator